MSQLLFAGDQSSEDEDNTELKVNENFAKEFDKVERSKEAQKLKAKYGDGDYSDSEGSSSSSSDDEDGEELTEELEKDFYKTLSCLKSKDPKIYDANVRFFKEASEKPPKTNTKSDNKEKSLFLRDYERKLVIERGGKLSDSEDEEEFIRKQRETRKPTYVDEQRALRDSFKTAALVDDVEDDNLLAPKVKSAEEKGREDRAYREWLKGQKRDIDETESKQLKPLRDFWTDPKLSRNDKFLRDYILNKKFVTGDESVENEGYVDRIHDSDDNLSEDEKTISKQEEFEHKYNYRYEEPDQEFIKRYPRTMENSLRKKDTKRAEKRVERKERKEEEKIKKQEELKRLKALKRKEIEEKIDKIREITGNDDLNLDNIDLDGDFDPEEHDRKMRQVFNEDYYQHAEGDEKPEFPEFDKELDLETGWDDYNPENNEYADGEEHCEDSNFNMDADYQQGEDHESEMIDSTKKKKRRRRNKFSELLAKKKPKFDPKSFANYEQYYDQYYGLDYEDLIGDVPCRFKYRKVVANDYGLTFDEILAADEKELNKWISLKKALQHKPEHVELNDVKVYRMKGQNEQLKRKVLPSLFKSEATEEEGEENAEIKKKRRRKKKINSSVEKSSENGESSEPIEKKRKQEENNVAKETNKVEQSANSASKGKKKSQPVDSKDQLLKKKNNKSEKQFKKKGGKRIKDVKNTASNISNLSDERLKAFGLNPKKFRNKLKYGKKKE